MTGSALPETSELLGLIRSALDDAHDCERTWGLTRSVKWHVWKLGFDYAGVYPIRSFYRRGKKGQQEFDQAEAYAERRLHERGVHFWPRGEEHSTLKEFQYDVSWAAFDGEYTGFGDDNQDLRTPAHVPPFKRLVLALESELSGGPAAAWPRWQVLFDFNKLLCARADLRVLVWPRDKIAEGSELLESRLRGAAGWGDGYWLLSGWGRDGFEHIEYHNGHRQD